MDDPAVPPEDLEKALIQLATINRLLGGHSTTLRGLQRLLPAGTRSFSFLDVGCGGGDTLAAVRGWAVRKGLEARLRGIELSPVSVDLASRRLGSEADIQLANLFDLQPEHHSCDVVHAALVLHHLNDSESIQALAHMASLARVGVIVNDLHRHRLAHDSILLLTRAFSRNPLIRNDAPLSVRRAFTRDELHSLARRAGLPHARVVWRWAFRWLMTAATPEVKNAS